MLTLVTATYNSEKTLAQTFDSVLNQTYSEPFEYIIMDAESKDNTLDIIKKYEPLFSNRNIDFKWVSKPDEGIYDAWNKAINMANGDWIGFIGSDDVYLPNAIETYVNYMHQNPEADYICSHVEVIIQGTKAAVIHIDKYENGRLKNLAHVGSFHNRKYFEKYGTFDLKYKVVGDYELLLRNHQLNYILMPDALVKMGYGGVSTKMIFKTLKEVKDARLSHKFDRKFVENQYRKEVMKKAVTYSITYIFGESFVTKIKNKLLRD